jgi:four helix bundle protein
MSDFKKLRVWQEAHGFTIATILAMKKIRGSVGILVRNQLVRSTMSIPANIAEGSAKRSDREFARFVKIALGSATESENHLILARDLKLISGEEYNALDERVQQVQKMLYGLETKLTQDASSKRPVQNPAASRG